jgi:hypothetical protein
MKSRTLKGATAMTLLTALQTLVCRRVRTVRRNNR